MEINSKVREKTENKRAITLVALVITIVVLIILAGVAMYLSLGENGIFNRAKQAKKDYQDAELTENLMVSDVTNQIDTISGERASGDVNSEIQTLQNKIAELEQTIIENQNKMNYNDQTETIIGKWTNGKPIYRKITTIDMSTAHSMNSTADIGIRNMEYCVNMYGMMARTGGKSNVPINSYESSSYYLLIKLNTNGSISYGNEGYLGMTTLIVEYTKTTDSATN